MTQYNPVRKGIWIRFLVKLAVSDFYPDIQNELINLLAARMRQTIILSNQRPSATVLYLIYQTVHTQNRPSKLSGWLRSSNTVEIKELIIDLTSIHGEIAEVIIMKITKALEKDELHLEYCWRQSYNNHATMPGVHTVFKN